MKARSFREEMPATIFQQESRVHQEEMQAAIQQTFQAHQEAILEAATFQQAFLKAVRHPREAFPEGQAGARALKNAMRTARQTQKRAGDLKKEAEVGLRLEEFPVDLGELAVVQMFLARAAALVEEPGQAGARAKRNVMRTAHQTRKSAAVLEEAFRVVQVVLALADRRMAELRVSAARTVALVEERLASARREAALKVVSADRKAAALESLLRKNASGLKAKARLQRFLLK